MRGSKAFTKLAMEFNGNVFVTDLGFAKRNVAGNVPVITSKKIL